MTDAVVLHRKTATDCAWTASITTAGVAPIETDGVADQVLQQLHQLHLSPSRSATAGDFDGRDGSSRISGPSESKHAYSRSLRATGLIRIPCDPRREYVSRSATSRCIRWRRR